MARGSKGGDRGIVKGAKLEPIRVVRRELTRPDGTTVQVDVPVYPPFRLEDRSEKRAEKRGTAPPRESRDSQDPPKRKTG